MKEINNARVRIAPHSASSIWCTQSAHAGETGIRKEGGKGEGGGGGGARGRGGGGGGAERREREGRGELMTVLLITVDPVVNQ